MDFLIEYDATGRVTRYGPMQAGLRMYARPFHEGTTLAFFDMTGQETLFSRVSADTHYVDPQTGSLLTRPHVNNEPAPDLTDARVRAAAQIDTEAEQLRTHFITPGAGQSLVYEQKRREAETMMANANTPLASLPHIRIEAQMNGITPREQAKLFLAMSQRWSEVSAQIETIRLSAKVAIFKAQTHSQIHAVQPDWSPVTALINSSFGE